MTENENWKDELQSVYLYKVLAEKEGDSPQGRLFLKLALEAEAQAKIWKDPLPDFRPNLRIRLVAQFVRLLGPRALLSLLSAHKIRGLSLYTNPLSAHPRARTADEVGSRHRHHQNSGNLRAAVFGVNDGVVSNCLLILGFAGASGSTETLVLAGTAGLLAGAFSMAAGEYISVKSQQELLEHQLDLERQELEKYPEEEAHELALIYEAKGIKKEEAVRLANQLIKDPVVALDTLAKEELGIDPAQMASPLQAAIFSFVAFSLGACVPLLPFVFATSELSLSVSIALSGATLFGTGAFTSFISGRNMLFGGLRMLSIAIAAGAIVYWIGEQLGA